MPSAACNWIAAVWSTARKCSSARPRCWRHRASSTDPARHPAAKQGRSACPLIGRAPVVVQFSSIRARASHRPGQRRRHHANRKDNGICPRASVVLWIEGAGDRRPQDARIGRGRRDAGSRKLEAHPPRHRRDARPASKLIARHGARTRIALAPARTWGYPCAMQIVRDYDDVDQADRGASVAIGNCDGVHLGHQSVIDIAREHAADLGAPLGVLTFEPHPREYFAPDAPPFRLMSREARAHRLQKLGIEKLYELNFNAAMAALSPYEFARTVIARGLGLRHVVVGADFCFGKGRAGDARDLDRFGREMGFGVTIAELLEGRTGQVSSTAIRAALSEGRPRDAAAMLGHWHRIDGPVVGGEQRGRELGYPTANMSIEGLHPPRFGVYAVLVEVRDGPHKGHYHGAASLGVRPMFHGETPNIETFLFDFAGDLYGADLSVALVEYLRPEETFDSLEAFIAQMDADCARARDILGQP